jgi:hypothetical protein
VPQILGGPTSDDPPEPLIAVSAGTVLRDRPAGLGSHVLVRLRSQDRSRRPVAVGWRFCKTMQGGRSPLIPFLGRLHGLADSAAVGPTFLASDGIPARSFGRIWRTMLWSGC